MKTLNIISTPFIIFQLFCMAACDSDSVRTRPVPVKKKVASPSKVVAKSTTVESMLIGRTSTSESISSSQFNSNIINIRDYGAYGDGLTDDTGAFQSAINFLHSKGGGVLTVPDGQYALYDQLMLYPNTAIQGSGWNAVLQLKKSILPKSMLFCNTKGSNISLSRLKIETVVNGFGIEIHNVDNVSIKEVYLAGGWFPAVWIFDGTNPIIENSYMDSGGSFVTLTRTVGGRGIGNKVINTVEAFDINEECSGFSVESNQFINIEEEGVDINGSKDIIVEGNKFESCNNSPKTNTGAVHITGTASGHSSTTDNIRVLKNTFLNSRYSAVRIARGDIGSSLSNITIGNNSIVVSQADLNSYGIRLHGMARDVRIQGNSISGTYRAFESFDNVSHNVVLDSNVIRNSKLEGVDISNLDSPKLYNNEVYSSGAADVTRSNISIRSGNSGTVLIRGGVLSNSPRHAVMSLDGSTFVEDVDVSGNKVSPFFIAETASLLSRGCKGYINYFFGTNSPSAGHWDKGDRIYKESPSGDVDGWICTTAGWANKNVWKSGASYQPSVLVNNSGRVYRCVKSGIGLSQVSPNHTAGSVTTSDGFTWEFIEGLAVFRGVGQAAIRTLSSAATLTNDDEIVLLTGAVPFTVILPGTHEAGKKFTFKDSSGNSSLANKTIQAVVGQSIDGATTLVINTNRSSVTIVSDGTNWHLI